MTFSLLMKTALGRQTLAAEHCPVVYTVRPNSSNRLGCQPLSAPAIAVRRPSRS